MPQKSMHGVVREDYATRELPSVHRLSSNRKEMMLTKYPAQCCFDLIEPAEYLTSSARALPRQSAFSLHHHENIKTAKFFVMTNTLDFQSLKESLNFRFFRS